MIEIELKKEIQQLQKEVEDIKAQMNKTPLRITPATMSIMEDLRWAVVNEVSPPSDVKIKCLLLDKSGQTTEEEVDVYCNIITVLGAKLGGVVPRLKKPQLIPIRRRNVYSGGETLQQWWCDWPLNDAKACPC